MGMDAGFGKKRAIPTQRARFKKAKLRKVQITKLWKRNKKAGKLARTGLMPQATWGQQGKGMAPSRLKELRGTMVKLSSAWRPGACSSTAIELMWGEEKDPFFEQRWLLFQGVC